MIVLKCSIMCLHFQDFEDEIQSTKGVMLRVE
jgi:hypothetical protein